uniref:Ig-like domain-containing protein n=1 Tax=Stegastes partitus TaxID=144197 RepID=A0A3B4ZAV8_9TELE
GIRTSLCCSSFSDKVRQTPANIYDKPGQTAKIQCSHNIPNYYRILWYKKLERQLQLLGYMDYGNASPEPGLDVKMDGDASQGRNCTLTIENLSVNSSAVYFCAAIQKPPLKYCKLYKLIMKFCLKFIARM